MVHPTPHLNDLRKVSRSGHHSKQVLLIALPLLFVLFFVAHLGANFFIQKRVNTAVESLKQSLDITAENRVLLLQNWLSSAGKNGKYISENPLFQIFSQEVVQSPTLNQLEKHLIEELPYMQEGLNTYIQQYNYAAAYLANEKSQIFLSSGGAPILNEHEKSWIAEAYTHQKTLYSPIYILDKTLYSNMYQPIFPLQTLQEEQNTLSILITRMPVQNILSEKLAPSLLKKEIETILLQGNQRIQWEENVITPYKAQAGDIQTSQDVLGTNFTVIQKASQESLAKITKKESTQIKLIAYLIAFSLALIILALWWQHQEAKEFALLSQYRRLAEHINAQRKLLSNINDTVKEQITLKDLDGKYTYVNPSFAKSFSLLPEEVVGLDDNQLYNSTIGERMRTYDDEVLSSAEPFYAEETISIDGEVRYMEISKTPLQDSQKHVQGIVTVMRDISDVMKERIAKEKALKNNVRVFSRMMQQHDPYLLKSANLVQKLSFEVAQSLGLDQKEKESLSITAQLWQIGKIFVPAKVLEKKKRTATEELEYRTHIEKSTFILDTIDWHVPVVSVMYQMHERLDGSGYPLGVKGDKIHELPKILAVCNEFVKATLPRSHTKHMTPEDAFTHMHKLAHQLDIKYIEQLEKVIKDDPAIIMNA